MERNRKDDKSQTIALYEYFKQSPNITTDTRNIKKGDIFFALKGGNFNGNTFADKAIELGASLAVIDEKEYAVNDKCFLVDNVLKMLQKLANHHRKQFPSLKMLSITGTNGKTTTKELCHAVLSKKYNTIATIGNLNNHIGVPLTLLRINKETEIAIVEMGANHIGEIAFLCTIAEPNFGLITNIGKAHLEGFGSYEGVIEAKTEMFRYLDSHKGACLINIADNALSNYAHLNKGSHIYYEADIIDGDTATIRFEDEIVTSNLIGSYNGNNIMAALTIGHLLAIDKHKSIDAIQNYIPTNNRSQIKKTSKNTLILDCYNANPSSVHAALEDFIANKSSHKALCLGGMCELGNETKKEHEKVISIIDKTDFDSVILVGDEFKEIINNDTKYKWFAFSEEAKQYIEKNPIINHTILIKGSRSKKMEILEDVL